MAFGLVAAGQMASTQPCGLGKVSLTFVRLTSFTVEMNPVPSAMGKTAGRRPLGRFIKIGQGNFQSFGHPH